MENNTPGTKPAAYRFVVSDLVEKTSGDYCFKGVVVARFVKVSGAVRVVVENQDGILHIFSEKNLTHVTR